MAWLVVFGTGRAVPFHKIVNAASIPDAACGVKAGRSNGDKRLAILSRQRGPLPAEAASRYLEQIGAALDYAHARHVAHLDLKPLNLLVHEDGRLLLSDFGLAHLMEQGAIEGSTSLQFGTPSYMAPEHLQGQPERRSDLYALGIMK